MNNKAESSRPSGIYLDTNATTRPFPEVVETLAHHFYHSYANPGSRHAEGRRARQTLETAREQIAEILGANPNEVIFTSGGTEATNMAIFGLAASAPGTIALTAGEHPATIESCKALQTKGWKLHILDVDPDGRLITKHFTTLPWDDIKLVTVILAHNETGVTQDLQPLSNFCRKHAVPFHADAVQAVGKIPVNFHELGVSSLSLGAHKFHGPRGIGALLLRDGLQLTPIQFGGHQEFERRPGTEMVALAAGMARALQLFHARVNQWTHKLTELRDRLENGLLHECSPVVVNGSRQYRLPNTLNIAFPGLDGEALLVALDLDGVACSLGSTCASGSAEPAPVLVAMDRPEEVYSSSVRFSVSIENSLQEIDQAVVRIAGVVKHQRQLAEVMV